MVRHAHNDHSACFPFNMRRVLLYVWMLSSLIDSANTSDSGDSMCVSRTAAGLCVLEGPTRLSKSMIMTRMRQFYDKSGNDAWGAAGPVPFRATTSSYLAREYARVIVGYAKDRLRRAAAHVRANATAPAASA